jgi:hypothetical protein
MPPIYMVHSTLAHLDKGGIHPITVYAKAIFPSQDVPEPLLPSPFTEKLIDPSPVRVLYRHEQGLVR